MCRKVEPMQEKHGGKLESRKAKKTAENYEDRATTKFEKEGERKGRLAHASSCLLAALNLACAFAIAFVCMGGHRCNRASTTTNC